MHKILLVEDDESFGYVMSTYLEMHNYQVEWLKNGEDGLAYLINNLVDLCILDIMLPGIDGFETALKIQQIDNSIPFIFLSAKSLKVDRLKGFKTGADDYIVKPIDEEILLAKINAIISRVSLSPTKRESALQIGQYRFDPVLQTLTINDKCTKLTQKESKLLNLLFEHKNSLLERKKALIKIWGSTDEFNRKSMDVFISKLRKHLSHDHQIYIQNIHGKGFILHA